MRNRVYNYLNNNYLITLLLNFLIGVFIDLSKASDTVNHNILIDKLNLYGIKNNSLKWFASYLSNRKPFIQTGAIKTSSLDIICGVPQLSILGPLIFIIYVNDICNISKIFEPIIFTDDKSLFFSHKSIKELFHTANLELKHLGTSSDCLTPTSYP